MVQIQQFSDTNSYMDYVLEKSNQYLDMCRIYGEAEERKGLIKNIEKSVKAKSWIFDILSKCDGWNGKGQVVLPTEITGEIDENAINEFYDFLKNNKDLVLEELVAENGMTYEEMRNLMKKYYDYMLFAAKANLKDDELIIKGKPVSFYENERRELDRIQNTLVDSGVFLFRDNMVVSKESLEEKSLIGFIITFISENKEQYLREQIWIDEVNRRFADRNIRISNGVKISRVVNKMLKATKLYSILMKDENLRDDFKRKLSFYFDAINPIKVKRWTVISCNFVDYLSMSHGHKWTSCLNTDKGGYITEGMWGRGFCSRRTLDYALDPSTIVMYTIDSDYDGNDFELEPKITRQLFHFNGSALIQGRLYPQATTARRKIYTNYRNVIQRVLCEGMGVNNFWYAPQRGEISPEDGIAHTPYEDVDYDGFEYNEWGDKIHNGDFIDFFTFASHDRSCEKDFQSEVNYTERIGDDDQIIEYESIQVGEVGAVDIITGKEMHEYYSRAIIDGY